MKRAMQIAKSNVYTADFETTGKPNLDKDGEVRVFLWSLVECETLKSWYGYSIESFLQKIVALNVQICYFHNLKFDGFFIIDYLLRHNQNFKLNAPNSNWFSLEYKNCEFRDSLKKFKMTVEGLSIFLGIERKKDISTNGVKPWDTYLPCDYIPSLKEIEYCIHDSRIIAVAIGKEWDEGRRRLTASSEAYNNAKSKLPKFKQLFPKLSKDEDSFVRKAYKGGICAVNPKYKGVELDNIYAYDVNGLYGYVMDTAVLPYGYAYDGKPVSKDDLYIVNFFCEFKVRDWYFPMLQIKNSIHYAGRGNEFLTESNGITELTLTCIDYDLFKEHYHVYNEFGHVYKSYKAKKGILSPIIQENIQKKAYYSKKETYDPYKRGVAKDNTNMLYGSFGLSTVADNVTPFINERGVVEMKHEKSEKDGRYIPMAVFITANARKITLTAIQNNYDNWVYSDTDSMYLLAPAKDIPLHQEKSGHWKFETWENCGKPFPKGKFLRQKTYCLADENKKIYRKYDKYGDLVSELKCAGMPADINKTIEWDDFVLNKSMGTRLQRKVVKGGVCLLDLEYGIYDN